MENNTYIYSLLLGLLLLGGCQEKEPKNSFPTTIIQDQIQAFDLNLQGDTLLQTKSKALLVVPQCAFLLNGKVIENELVKLQFVELYKPTDFTKTHLQSLTDKGELLESAGMFHIQATTADNQSLEINPASAPLLRYGSNDIIPNLQLYKGVVENELIVWTKPAPLEKWLVPIPMKQLNFYANSNKSRPINWEQTNHKKPKALLIQLWDNSLLYCGLKNEFVDTLYSSVLENTLIATKEFEMRMRFIHQSCSEEVLFIYLRGLDKNLYELDSLAYEYLKAQNHPQANNFHCFYQQKLTKVANAKQVPNSYIKCLQKSVKRSIDLDNLKSVLTHSLRLSTAGWHNVDALFFNSIRTPVEETFQLTTKDFTIGPATVYCILKTRNSVIKLDFDRANNQYSVPDVFNYTDEKEAVIYAIAIEGKQAYSAIQEIKFGKNPTYQLELKPTNAEETEAVLSNYGLPREENSFRATKSSCCYYK
jgi:hypothetical protein